MSAFLGRPIGGQSFAARDGAHVFQVQDYAFPDGTIAPYVCVWEDHDGGSNPRVMALSTVVHLLQNVGDDEAYQIGNRTEAPP